MGTAEPALAPTGPGLTGPALSVAATAGPAEVVPVAFIGRTPR